MDDDWQLFSRAPEQLHRRPSHYEVPLPAATPARPARRPYGGSRAALVVLVLAIVLVALASTVLQTPPWLIGRSVASRFDDLPTPGREAAEQPLGSPVPGPRWSDSFAFLGLQADGTSPITYDPCRPIHYVVRPLNAPPGGAELIEAAVARVSSATGLRFVFDGSTSEAPSERRKPFQPERYGDRWAPVLITWATPDEAPDLAGAVTGVGGSTPIRSGSLPQVYVTGAISLDGPQIEGILGRPQGTSQSRAIIMHEFAHLVGLDHVGDRSQLMYPEAVPWVSQFGAGDLTGLAALGKGDCVSGY